MRSVPNYQANKICLKNRGLMLTSAVVSLSIFSIADAASDTWTGNADGSWSNSANWVSANTPGAGDTATFNAASPNTTIGLDSGVLVNQLVVGTSNVASYTFGAGGPASETLSLGDGGAIQIDSAVTSQQGFDANIVLGTSSATANYSIRNDSDALMTINGVVRGHSDYIVSQYKYLSTGGSGNILINGALTDGGVGLVLNKTGSGTLTLANNNNYSGGTTVTSGVLKIGIGGATGSLPGSVLNNGTLIFDRSTDYTYVNTISGTGDLIQTGSNKLSLNGANTYSGNTYLRNGTLAALLMTSLGKGTITFQGGALELSSIPVSMDFSSRIHNSTGAMQFNLTGGHAFNSELDSSNTGGLTKLGAGRLTLNVNNSYSGVTTLAGGQVRVVVDGALGASNQITFAGGSLSHTSGNLIDYSSLVHNSTGPINIDTNGQNLTYATGFDATNTGGLTKAGAGTLTLSDNQAYTGVTTVSGGTLLMLQNNPVLAGINVTAGTMVFSGNSSSIGPVAISSSGTLTLSGSNSSVGPVALGTGKLVIGSNSALGTPTDVTFNGGTLLFAGSNSATSAIRVHVTSSSSVVNIDVADQNSAYLMSIDGANSWKLTKSGMGTLYVSGNSTSIFSSTTTLTNGVLQVDSPNALGTSGDIVFNPGTNTTILRHSSGNQVDYSNRIRNSSIINIDTNNQIVKYASFFGNSASNLIKNGLGTLILTQDNTFFDSVIINQGNLQLESSGNFSPAITITNNSSIALRTGIIDLGSKIVGTGTIKINGSGIFSLSNVNNTYSGGTEMVQGLLRLTNANQLGTGEIKFSGGSLIHSSNSNVFVDISGRIKNSSSPISIRIQSSVPITYASVIDSSNVGGLALSGNSTTLNLLANNSYTGPTSVSQNRLISSYGIKTQGSLSITSNGKVEILPGGDSSKVSALSSFTISGTGSHLQLHDNDLVLNYGAGDSSYTSTVDAVKSGLSVLGGNGTGITSAEVDSQSVPGTMLAVVDGGDPAIAGSITELSGYTIPSPSTSVLVKYTWFGDANLDGVVTNSDYALIDTGFSSGGTLKSWIFGDFDYDGNVNGSDYALADTGFIAQTGALPEPTTLGFLGLGSISALRRKRRM